MSDTPIYDELAEKFGVTIPEPLVDLYPAAAMPAVVRQPGEPYPADITPSQRL